MRAENPVLLFYSPTPQPTTHQCIQTQKAASSCGFCSPQARRIRDPNLTKNPRPDHAEFETSPRGIRDLHLTHWRGLGPIEDSLHDAVGRRKTSTRPGRKGRATVRSNRWRAPRTGHVSHALKRTTCPKGQSLPPG